MALIVLVAVFEQAVSQLMGVLLLLQVDVSQKRVKEEREVLERQRMVLRRQNAALLKE